MRRRVGVRRVAVRGNRLWLWAVPLARAPQVNHDVIFGIFDGLIDHVGAEHLLNVVNVAVQQTRDHVLQVLDEL